jgi:hypothetical protein
MNSREIEELIGKFYEGATTPEEERQLRELFSHGEVPSHLAVHAGLFRFYEDEAKEVIPDPDFEKNLQAALDEPPVIQLNSRRKYFLYLASMAATFLLLVGLIFTFRNDVFRRSSVDQANLDAAYRQTQQALLLLSVNLNTGLDQTQKLGHFQQGLDQMKKLQAFQTGLEQMKKFSNFYQYQPLIINPGDQNRP